MRAAVLHGARDGDHGTAWSSALLGRGADVNYQDERGRTPLHWAVERGDEEHFDALLDADATLDLADDRGRTPLHGCCEIVGDVHNQFIRRLLDAAGELGTLKLVNAADDAGATGLMLATVAQNVPAMRLLLDARADAARVERVGGRTALDVALDREGDTSKSKVVELLRSAAAMQAKEDAAAHQEFLSLLKDERALLGEAGVFDGPLQRERDSQRDLLEAAETARLTTHNSRPSIETDAQIFTLVARAAAEIGVKDANGAAAALAPSPSPPPPPRRRELPQYLPGLPRSSSRSGFLATCPTHRHQAGVGGAYREVRGAVAAGGSVAIVVPVKRRRARWVGRTGSTTVSSRRSATASWRRCEGSARRRR